MSWILGWHAAWTGTARCADIILHRAGAPPERVPLAAPVVLGGPAEELRFGGVPAVLLFSASAAGVVVEASVQGARVAGRPLEPGGRRLLRPGERSEYLGLVVEIEPDPPAEGTRAMAGRLLLDAFRGTPPIAGTHLLVLDGPRAGLRVALGSSQTLGRGRTASIPLPDSEASRIHARVRVTREAIGVEDLGSKNGVRVNGQPIGPGFSSLRDGDEIGVGSTTLALVVPGDHLEPSAPMLGVEPYKASALRPIGGRWWAHLPRWPDRPTPAVLALVAAATLLAAATGLGLAATGN